MELNTERLQLRELLFTDVEKIHELHSLPETDEFNTLGIPESIEVTRQIVSEWLEAQNEVPRKKYVFCIENSEKEFIGLAGLNYGKPAYRNAELWYKLHSKYWGLATLPKLQTGYWTLVSQTFNCIELKQVAQWAI
jgi:[ribosomal protein S5]-alanine N-acetyltransferase